MYASRETQPSSGADATVLERVRRGIARNRLISRGETVVVGVSGGPDSLCLLHILKHLCPEYDLALHVAHLNHGLRGEDADADAQFVRSLAADWGMAYTVDRVNVPALAQEKRLAIEEAARRARYEFLSRVAASVSGQTIAVGHNADDQAETVLMHWVRGSGLAGLRGMLPSTPMSDYRLLDEPQSRPSLLSRLHLIRPLLEVTRAEVAQYCTLNGLTPRFDRSNLDTTRFRSWLRYVVIPLLAQHNPRIQQVMRRAATVIADDYAVLRSLTLEIWSRVVREESEQRICLDLAVWRELPVGLQRSILREAIHRLRRSLRDISFQHVEDALAVAIEGTAGHQATLPQGLMLAVGYDLLTLGEATDPCPLPAWPLLPGAGTVTPLTVPGVTTLPGDVWALEAAISDRWELPHGWDANADPWLAYLDAEVAGSQLRLRTRGQGDRFQPLGMGGNWVQLAGFLTNRKVPPGARDRLPLLVGDDRILWVCGQRIAESARVRSETRRVLVLHFVRLPGR